MSTAALQAHLETGCTTVARCWAVTRKDSVTLGFTDHDRALSFDGIVFAAESGMTAKAFEQTTGLAVDNTEAVGALSHAAIREADLRAGRFDGAEVRCWLVNWKDVEARRLIFRGSIGEIEREGSAFRAEFRGLAEQLNQPQGRVYQRPCTAVLGDGMCQFDTSAAGFSVEAAIISVEAQNVVLIASVGQADGWFRHGRLTVLSGAAEGLVGVVKRDREEAGVRRIELWEEIRAEIALGDTIRIEAGCDKRAETCREKFGNFLNFRGFPDIPGEDWLLSYPVRSGRNDGGSLR